jgi:hypothetical protein
VDGISHIVIDDVCVSINKRNCLPTVFGSNKNCQSESVYLFVMWEREKHEFTEKIIICCILCFFSKHFCWVFYVVICILCAKYNDNNSAKKDFRAAVTIA